MNLGVLAVKEKTFLKMDSPLLYIQSVTSQQPLSSLHIWSDDTIKVSNQEINYAQVPNNMPVASKLMSGKISENYSNGSIPFPGIVTEPPCQWIMYAEIGNSRVRIWDLIILIPNAMFLLFLLWNLRFAIAKLRSMSSSIFAAFFSLVVVVALISVLRCIVSMTVNASDLAGDITDKVLWLVLRFFLLGTELSVVIFGLAFGHLESQTSIRRVLLMTSTIALLYSCTQGILEFLHPDGKFLVRSQNFSIFGHGGMIFWTSSSAFFFVVYSCIFILPWTRLKQKLNLPSKKSFYVYAAILAILNFVQTVGSALLLDIHTNNLDGMCIVDVTTYLYFTFFDPLVYGTFLREFFQVTTPGILFSYKSQMDETEDDDTVSLPYQASNSKDIDDDMDASYDSTHFDRQHGLFNQSINSDISITSRSLRLDPEYYQNSA